MQIRKSRWSNVYESAEEELIELLARKGITAHRWTVDGGETVDSKLTSQDTQLWCAEGQLVCTVGTKAYSLQPGDVLNIPNATPYSIKASFSGCVCYESTATPS